MMQTSTAQRSNVIRESFSRRAFLKLNTVFLILVCFLMLYPVVYVIACSFSEETAILRGDVSFLPVQPHVKAYTKVFNYPQLWTSYRNTILYTMLLYAGSGPTGSSASTPPGSFPACMVSL